MLHHLDDVVAVGGLDRSRSRPASGGTRRFRTPAPSGRSSARCIRRRCSPTRVFGILLRQLAKFAPAFTCFRRSSACALILASSAGGLPWVFRRMCRTFTLSGDAERVLVLRVGALQLGVGRVDGLLDLGLVGDQHRQVLPLRRRVLRPCSPRNTSAFPPASAATSFLYLSGRQLDVLDLDLLVLLPVLLLDLLRRHDRAFQRDVAQPRDQQLPPHVALELRDRQILLRQQRGIRLLADELAVLEQVRHVRADGVRRSARPSLRSPAAPPRTPGRAR